MDIRVKRTTKQVKLAIVMSFVMAFISVFGIFYSTSIEVTKLAAENSTEAFAATEEISNDGTDVPFEFMTLNPSKDKTFSFTNGNLKMSAANNDNLQVEESMKSNTVLSKNIDWDHIKIPDKINTAVVEEEISNKTNLVQSENVEVVQEVTAQQEVQAEPVVETADDPIYKFNRNSDLAASRKISVEKMNTVIAKSAKMCGGTPFENQGAIFIEASEHSGLDPIYIFAHACFESGYGKSYQARNKHNYFGIASFDSSPNSAYVMGNDMRSGIINGAVWISEHYYQQGQTTLHSMIYGKKCYATARDKWINNILSIMNRYTD